MAAEAKEPQLSDVFIVLSCNPDLKLFEAHLLAGRGKREKIDPNDFGGTRTYYRSLGRLRNLSMIKKKNKYKEYEVTTFGIVVYYSVVLAARKAHALYWTLQAIDILSNNIYSTDRRVAIMPPEQHRRLIESLISDKETRNILFQFLGDKSALTEDDEEETPESYSCTV